MDRLTRLPNGTWLDLSRVVKVTTWCRDPDYNNYPKHTPNASVQVHLEGGDIESVPCEARHEANTIRDDIARRCNEAGR